MSSQAVHEAYGGVVPELASHAHQQNIVQVVHEALKRAGVTKEQLSAVAFTRGPGLMGSLLVGVSFAKGFARSLNIPMFDVNHLQAHVSVSYTHLDVYKRQGIGGFIDGFQNILMWIPFYVTIALLAILAWYKSGKGVSIFTILGLLLIWGMGFWNETMQTLALVLSSTIIALIMGLPLGIWSANSKRCDKILHPILDLMQTMPAFVYLIPAVLFFGLGTVPGAFATIILDVYKRQPVAAVIN